MLKENEIRNVLFVLNIESIFNSQLGTETMNKIRIIRDTLIWVLEEDKVKLR